jgi:hypothetical protein
MALTPAEAPDLLAVLRFVQDAPGQEALAIGLAAAWLKAAPAAAVQGEAGTQALDALGSAADRLASRASGREAAGAAKGVEATLAAHLDVARRYGVQFTSYEADGRMQVCYDGEAFRRVLAMAPSSVQSARAALGLTRPECVDPNLRPLEHNRVDQWRADVLDRVDTTTLPGTLKNRVLMRRASLWSALAYQRSRLAAAEIGANGAAATAAASRALNELAGVQRSELTDEDLTTYNDAALRTNASRWAAAPPTTPAAAPGKLPTLITQQGQPGETCVLLVDAQHPGTNPLARRCTYSLVWAQSATLNREGNALALAVQPLQAWRELWIFRKLADGWAVNVLPPATLAPDTGYAEFAGWVPGGKQMLVAREARGEGKYQRSFAVLNLDSLVAERQAAEPDVLGAFQRWQDAGWKRSTVSIR